MLLNLKCANFNVNIILIQQMTEVKIEDIEANYGLIEELLGTNSFVAWDGFTKNSSELIKSLDQLSKSIAIYKEVQHKKFIITMKKLKGADIPDLIKTVKAKKLPRQALKAILGRFKLNQGKIELVETPEALKEQSKKIYTDYITINETLTGKLKQTIALVQETSKTSGLYVEAQQVKIPELVSTFKHVFTDDKINAAAQSVQVQYLPGTIDTLHIKSYAQIVDSSFEVVKEEFRRLTIEARIKQRKLVNEPKAYLDSMIEYLTNTEVLILDAQKSIFNKLGISQTKIGETEVYYMERGYAQNILMIQSGLRSKVKESIVAQKPVSLEKAKQILAHQVNLLETKVEEFKKLFGSFDKSDQNMQMIPMILALALNDMIYEEHLLEQEDIMKNVTDQVIMSNQDFAEVFKKMQIAIIKLMQEAGLIPQQAKQFMQNAAQMGIQGQNLPQQNLTPSNLGGMLPGLNPMQLLQMQQLQQLEQVQKAQGKK